jgi:osmotically-inducible protein OsmY
MADADIKRRIEEQLYWDNRVDSSNVETAVSNGAVTLTGTVPTYTSRMAAEWDARSVLGVLAVNNLLIVQYRGEISVPDDRSIRDNILTLLTASASIDAANIEVSVVEGKVILKGSVSALWKKQRAEELVRDTVGVLEVHNELAVVPTENMTDELIAREIVNSIERNPSVEAENVTVRVENGTVQLSGTVRDWVARIAAYEAALYTAGVIDIRDDILIRG